MNNYNNFFSSSQFFSHDDLNWATTDPYNIFDETMLGSSIFYNPIYGYDNQLLLQSSFPFFEDDINNTNKDASAASSGNYIKDKTIQKPGASLSYSGNSNLDGSSASVKFNGNNNMYCQPPTTKKVNPPQTQQQIPLQMQSQSQLQSQSQYIMNRSDSSDTIFSCISQGSRYDNTEQLQRGGMVRADLSQYDLLYDSENSSSKHYIPIANSKDWSIFDQPRENFFNSVDFDYDFGETSNSLSLSIENFGNLNNNSLTNYNMPLTIDPSTIISNNNVKLEVEEDDPIIRSILCSESEEEVYEAEDEEDKMQLQQQQQQNSNLINSNKNLSDSEDDDDDDDDDIEENFDEDALNYSIFHKNRKDMYNKNGQELNLINTNIANKKNDLSIFTYETNNQNYKKIEHKQKNKDFKKGNNNI
eukprot:jgi/Orpsp1_1/1191120/evm.model.d7180000083616.1